MCKYVISLLLVAAVLLPATSGVQAGVYVTLTDPDYQRFYIDIPDNTPVVINVRMDNDAGEDVTAISNGIRIYSPTGATWQTPTYDAGPNLATYFDGGIAVYGGSVDGTNDDTIGVSAYAMMEPGVPNGYDDVILTVQTMGYSDGDTLCIDSAWFPPAGVWGWSTLSGTVTPSWGGPYCFAVVPSASISGTKFHDENGNSVWDGGEGVLDNVTIKLHGWLDAGGTIDLSTVTDFQGDYLFSGLAPGDYRVLEDLDPARGWQTYPLTVFHTVEDVQWGEHRTDLDFGNDTLCDDDSFETTETCLHGTDDDFDGPEPSNMSQGLYDWIVANVVPATVLTEFDQPANNQWFGHTFEGCWDDDCEVMAATLRIKLRACSGQTSTDVLYLGDYSQGPLVNGRIWGMSMNELDGLMGGDGVWSPGETMTVVLDLANLPPHGWEPTNILGALQDSNLDCIVADETEVDFIELYVELCCPLASIAGTKFHDEDGNSVWDGGEGVLDNVTIKLHGSLDAGGTVDLSTVTDAQGDYLFSGLTPGDYNVVEEVKSWWAAQTYPLNVFHTVTDVQWGDNITDLDFGNDTMCVNSEFVTCLHGTDDDFVGPEPSYVSPSLLAYLQQQYDYITDFDQPANNQCFGHTFEGCWDDECLVVAATLRMKLRASGGGAPSDWLYFGDFTYPEPDWRVYSISLNALETLAGGDGSWNNGDEMIVTLDLKNLPPRAWLPTNILSALQDGNLDFFLEDDTEVDWIELSVELCCPDGTICGYKFNDLNGDGIQDANEPGLPNWTITLDDGYMLYPQVTGPNGEYCFTGLAAGHYSIYEMGQAGWTQTYPQFVAYEIDLPTSGTGDWNLQNIDFGNYFCDTSEYEIILDSCLAGIKDNFALPTEPASPSPGLLANLQNCSGGADPNFDSDIIDRCFGHSFDECWTQDCPVISAQLHFKVQALSYGSSNDAIYLGDWSAGPGPSTWWIHLNDLAPYSSGTVLDYTFDLGNMPVAGHGPRNLLPYLQDKKLDVLIEDDTKVDFLELIFELCCPDCCELRGDFNHDGVIDIADLVALVDYMFASGPPPQCPEEADLNGDGQIDIADLVYLVDYMFNGGPAPVPCDQKAPAAKPISLQSDISFDVEYANGISTVVMNSPIDLRGIQLELKGTGLAPANLVGEHVDMIHGRDGWAVRVGLLDLNGGEIISADTREVVRFEGKYTLEAVIVADVNARSITPTIGTALKQNELPTVYTLSQNYPNPFNPSTSISFALPEAAEVRLEVFNLLGQRVTTLLNQRLDAGNHTAEWNSQNELGQTVASGVYFYRLETPRFTESKKMVLLK